MVKPYHEFIRSKSQWVHESGFKVDSLPDFLFPFQHHLVEWALLKGRSAIFADCGMGKTAMQLAWANEIVKRTNGRVLIATPLAVGKQTVQEAEKFGVEAARSRDGVLPQCKIIVTNYEQLHKYNPHDFAGMVCDESSCIKDPKSNRKDLVTEFCRTLQYRLACTATAAPNDYHELGTTSDALGLLGFRDMITKFFKLEQSGGHHAWGRTKYRFRGHAEQPFWSWVCSWARSLRMPSDLGFDDTGFVLPDLIENEYVVDVKKARPGMLFAMVGNGLKEERAERKNSIEERCELAKQIIEAHDEPHVWWCELNPEADRLEKIVAGAEQISGSMSDDEKEERYDAFASGQLKRLIIKPKIGAWGINWQHCSNTGMFPSHSYEQYYQAIRRFYRFGQTKNVKVSLVVGEGELGILDSIRRKTEQTKKMFQSIVAHMKDAMHLASSDYFPEQERIPSWL